MASDAQIDARNLLWVLLLSLVQVTFAGEVTEADCRRVQEEVTTFTQKNIVPLVDSRRPPEIEQLVVERLKRLRERVTTCALSDIPDDASGWNDDKFLRLDGRLAFFEVTMEQAAEEENPEITRILVNSRAFGEAVQELQQMLRSAAHPRT